MVNPAHQMVILARLSEYCQYHGATLRYERDPWNYMRRKLAETEEPLASLKQELFAATRDRLLNELKSGELDEERCADFKLLFERLLSPADFADLAIHLTTQDGAPATRARLISGVLSGVKPHTLFSEENKPAGERSSSWEKLVMELYRRLDLDRLDQLMRRERIPKAPARRKASVLRRVRRNVAEYCSVLRIPTDPSDTFTPFMLPRIEALIAANLRFLNRYR